MISRIIAQSGAERGVSVTTRTDPGYAEYGAQDQFISLSNNLHSIMQMNWKIVAPIAVVVIVAGVVMSGGSKEVEQLAVNNTEITKDTVEQPQPVAMAMKAAPMPVSGNIDDLVASVTSEGDGDLALIDGSAEDAALVRADNQSVNDFNTTYDEKTF
jgi:hypothetical protein